MKPVGDIEIQRNGKAVRPALGVRIVEISLDLKRSSLSYRFECCAATVECDGTRSKISVLAGIQMLKRALSLR